METATTQPWSPFAESSETAPASQGAPAMPDALEGADLTVLSIPQLPDFPVQRRGVAIKDLQEWHQASVVARFQELLDQLKQAHRQVRAAQMQAQQQDRALADAQAEVRVLREHVAAMRAERVAQTDPQQLQRVLVQAQVTADQMIADAEAQAAQMLDAAQADAEALRQQAEAEAERLIGTARQLYADHDTLVQRIQANSTESAARFRALADQLETAAHALATADLPRLTHPSEGGE